MAKYLLIESRDPFESSALALQYELAVSLAKEGNEVTVFLVQNGVLPARVGPSSSQLSKIALAGAKVLADDFSLRERGIGRDKLAEGVKAAPLSVVLDQLADGCKAIWH